MKGLNILLKNHEIAKERPQDTAQTLVREIVEEDYPCEGCDNLGYCDKTGKACEAFFYYVNQGESGMLKRRRKAGRGESSLPWDWRTMLRTPATRWARWVWGLDACKSGLGESGRGVKTIAGVVE